MIENSESPPVKWKKDAESKDAESGDALITTDAEKDSVDDKPADNDKPAGDKRKSDGKEKSASDKPVSWVMREPKEITPEENKTNPLNLIVLVALGVLLWMAGPTYFFFVLGVIFMIFLHELGHFMTARWTGMKVTQFFLCFGPRIWSTHRKGVEYGVRVIPAGAFVRIIGMNSLDPPEPEDAEQAYMNKSYPRRLLVISAGSIMHMIQAVLIFVFLSSVIGVNNPDKWDIGQISRLETGETPAVVAGLQPGDDIIRVGNQNTTNWRDLYDYVGERPGQEVELEFLRDGETFVKSTTLAEVSRENNDGVFETRGFLGIGPNYERDRKSPLVGIGWFGETTWTMMKFVPSVFSFDTVTSITSQMFGERGDVDIASEEANRPISLVGVVRIAGEPDQDITRPIEIMAFLNISLGLLNMLPLLPLDGGHAAIATYERLRSRNGRRYQVDAAKLLPITYAVVALLGFLTLSTFYLDIFNPITSS